MVSKFVVAFCGIIGLTMVYVVEGDCTCEDITDVENQEEWCDRRKQLTFFEKFKTEKEIKFNARSDGTKIINGRDICCETGFEPVKKKSMNAMKLC